MVLRSLSPVVSASYLFGKKHGLQYEKEQVKSLQRMLQQFGFVSITGLPQSVKTQRLKVLEHANNFFASPLEVKSKIAMSREVKRSTFRGYQPLRINVTNGIPDNHEGLDFMRTLKIPTADLQHPVLCGDNLWPDVDGFRKDYEDYLQMMLRIGENFLTALMFETGQEFEKKVRRFTSDPYWVMRLIRYPPMNSTFGEQGCGEHTDYGCLTFIVDNGVEGCIQCKKRESGEWICVNCPEDGFIVAIGDALEFWTEGFYKATPHRVLTPRYQERISVCFFYEPNYKAIIDGRDEKTYGQHLINKCNSNFL